MLNGKPVHGLFHRFCKVAETIRTITARPWRFEESAVADVNPGQVRENVLKLGTLLRFLERRALLDKFNEI